MRFSFCFGPCMYAVLLLVSEIFRFIILNVDPATCDIPHTWHVVGILISCLLLLWYEFFQLRYKASHLNKKEYNEVFIVLFVCLGSFITKMGKVMKISVKKFYKFWIFLYTKLAIIYDFSANL